RAPARPRRAGGAGPVPRSHGSGAGERRPGDADRVHAGARPAPGRARGPGDAGGERVSREFFSDMFLGGGGLLLAPRSPRRAELLRLVGARFRVVDPGEEPQPGRRAPEDAVCWLARHKASAVAPAHPGSWVLAADTLVFQDGELMGKPRDVAEARA